MPFCAILQCKNNSRTKSLTKGGISFHRFPKDPEIKEKWIDATGRQNWFPTKWSTVCSEHFDEKCFLIKKSGYKYLVDTALPIEKVFYFQKSQRKTNIQIEESTTETAGPSSENVLSPIPHKRKTNIDDFGKSPSPKKLRPETRTCENISSTASTPRKKRLHGMLRWKDNLIKKQNLQIRRLRARNSRLKKKITKIEDILKALEEKFLMDPENITNLKNTNVKNSAQSCDVLNRAIARYSNILSHLDRLTEPDDATPDPDTHLNSNDALYQGNLHRLFISLKSECETLPHHDMDERYNITIQSSNSVLSSSSVWGILRGLETFVQLFYVSQDYSQIRINETVIVDYPQYKFRGLLIDTGRHYLHLDKILKSLDAMEMNKMNVLHWHIVDDQSFPYQSEAFPELSAKGAFHHSLIYTKKDIKTIVKYAKNRGIRVLVEFDVPGHVRSWGAAFPKILTECYKSNKVVGLGPLNPIENGTYEFLRLLYREVLDRFPDSYLHIGGDEVDLACWSSNPKIQKYMKEKSLTTSQLHAEFMSKVYKLLPNHIKTLVWQEVYDNAVSLPDDTLIQVWKYEWITEMDKILKSGHQVVFSSSWYLDYLDQGWELFYKADPREMVYKLHKDESRLQNIVGGEACMWGEMVDDSNVVSRTWPRASTVAERLWTGVDYKNPSDLAVNDFVRRRLEGHTCRMVQRGVHAEPPSGPGFCLS